VKFTSYLPDFPGKIYSESSWKCGRGFAMSCYLSADHSGCRVWFGDWLLNLYPKGCAAS